MSNNPGTDATKMLLTHRFKYSHRDIHTPDNHRPKGIIGHHTVSRITLPKAINFSFSLNDVLQTISAAVSNEEEFLLMVSRSHMVERGLAQWKRQKKASPTSRLKIQFIGEAGLDTGALRKEFLTGTHIETKTFVLCHLLASTDHTNLITCSSHYQHFL